MKVLTLKTIMIYLFARDAKRYLSVGRLQSCLVYIYNELSGAGKLEDYDILFDTDVEAVERTVLFNNRLFDIDADCEIVYLRTGVDIDKLEKITADDFVIETIDRFVKENAI